VAIDEVCIVTVALDSGADSSKPIAERDCVTIMPIFDVIEVQVGTSTLFYSII
jgi:hypothetical protein